LNIIFVGFMGAGKSAIGRRLAKRLGYKFLDTDKMIVEKKNESITEIFSTKGEGYFRNLETEILKDLVNVNNTVISTGGGILTTGDNLLIMQKIGKIVFLDANLDDIIERVSRNKKRPLLQTKNPIETIKELHKNRMPLYEKADLKIKTHKIQIQKIVSLIIKEL